MKSVQVDALLNLLFPRNIHCLICGRQIMPGEKYSICGECSGKLRMLPVESICERCGRPLSSEGFDMGCCECAGMDFHFDRAASCFIYDDFSRKLIFQLKYGKKEYIAYHLAEMMRDRLNELEVGVFDIIIPVPLHELRERERGFNQSELIARELGEMRAETVMPGGLVRSRRTEDQTGLGRKKRFENLRGSFCSNQGGTLFGKKILLVDDVLTTGATADDCARALKDAGAEKVVVATVACR